MRVAVVNRKGSAGRTTVAVLLAAWLATQGRTVLVDLDFYPAAHTWAERARADSFEVITVGGDLVRALPRIAEGTTHLVLDTPSHDDLRFREALAASDVALVPTQPAPLDLWSLRQTSAALHNLRQERSLPTRVVLTMVRDTSTAVSARKAIEQDDLVSIPVLEPALSWQTDYAELGHEPAGTGRLPDLTEIAAVGEALMSDLAGA